MNVWKWLQRCLMKLKSGSSKRGMSAQSRSECESFPVVVSGGNFAQNDYKMSDYCINLELPTYLKQWVIHENGGGQPVAFPRLSTENKILESCLIKTPWFALPDLPSEKTVAISIPYFRIKHPKTYHYLPRKAREILAACIRNRFIIQLWQELHQHGHIGKRKDNLIYDWMTEHGIELTETNWNAIAKIYQRQHRNNLARKRKAKKSKKS